MPTLSILKNWSNYNDYGQITNSDQTGLLLQRKWLTNKGKIHALLAVRQCNSYRQVLDSENSIVIEQANNRTYAARYYKKYLKMHNKNRLRENWWKHN
jgi:N-succinyl-L-ornithine transcarbamylase